MSGNDFEENLFFGVHKYRPLLNAFYRGYCFEGRYVFLDKSEQSLFSTHVQLQLKTDTVIQKKADVSYGIEEKIAAWPKKGKPHTAFFLETRSCTNEGHESAGWMETCCADYLLYGFEMKDMGLVLYLLDFPRLRRWFTLAGQGYRLWVLPEKNRTEGRLVTIADVVRNVPTECFLLTFQGQCRRLKPEVDMEQLWRWYGATQSRTVASPQNEETFTDPEEPEDWCEVQGQVEEIFEQRKLEDLIQWADQTMEQRRLPGRSRTKQRMGIGLAH